MRPALSSRAISRPLTLRPALYNGGRNPHLQIGRQRRNFSASDVIEGSISLSQSFLQTVHLASGLPWVAALPLVALAVKVPIALFLHRPHMKDQGKRKHLVPLIATWKKLRQNRMKESAMKQNVRLSSFTANRRLINELKETQRDMYSRWKIRPWTRVLPFLQLPIWLAISEALRRMVGMGVGPLGIIQAWTSDLPPGDPARIEPSMATEGALWIPDLLAADPTHVLPIVLGASIFSSTVGLGTKSPAEIASMDPTARVRARFSTGLTYGIRTLAVVIVPTLILAKIPAGLMVFWVSSNALGTIQARALRKIYMSAPSPMPCREKSVKLVLQK